MNIYISNLSFNVQDEDLRGYFTEFGEVSSAKIIMDKATSRSRGFGFVEMSDEEGAKKAITALDGSTIDGRAIKVTEAREKQERSGSGYKSSGDRNFNNSSSYNKNGY